ncbi:hypothetical protein THASP1DRAFT_33727, partial [Thamnocephalis sphaerospora]
MFEASGISRDLGAPSLLSGGSAGRLSRRQEQIARGIVDDEELVDAADLHASTEEEEVDDDEEDEEDEENDGFDSHLLVREGPFQFMLPTDGDLGGEGFDDPLRIHSRAFAGGRGGGRVHRLGGGLFSLDLPSDLMEAPWGSDAHAHRYSPLEDEGRFLRQASGFRDVSRHPLLSDTHGAAGQGAGTSGDAARGRTVSRLREGNSWRSFEDMISGGAVQLLEQLLGRSGEMAGLTGGRFEINAPTRLTTLAGSGDALAASANGRALLGASGTGARVDGVPAQLPQMEAGAYAMSMAQDAAPLLTRERWQQMCQLIYGDAIAEKASRLVNHLLNAMVPTAMEEERQRKEQEAAAEEKRLQRLQREREEAAKRSKQEAAAAEPADAMAVDEPSLTTSASPALPLPADAETAPTAEPATEAPTSAAETAPSEEVLAEASTPPVVAEAPSSVDAAAATTQETESTEEGDAQMETTPPSAADEVSAAAEPGPSSAARTMVLVNGTEVDISDTGIDPTFLEALPDDLRQEVINQHLRERQLRQQQERLQQERQATVQPSTQAVDTTTGAAEGDGSDAANASATAEDDDEAGGISSEFLDALPPDIREEVLREERLERERRDRQRQGAPAPPPADMDPASFFATLDPQLRRTVILEQDDSLLANLSPDIVAEANALRGRMERSWRSSMSRTAGGTAAGGATSSAGAATTAIAATDEADPQAQAKPPAHRDALHIVDRQGVAALVRLLFAPQPFSKELYQRLLISLCESSRTRADLMALLLSVIQEGGRDLTS